MSTPQLPLRLVSSAPSAPHSTAERVIEILGDTVPPTGADIAAVRRRYNLGRRQFLAEMEPVESIFHIFPGERGVPRLTVIRPRNFREGEPLPAIVYLHGGGWTPGSLATYQPFCRQLGLCGSGNVMAGNGCPNGVGGKI